MFYVLDFEFIQNVYPKCLSKTFIQNVYPKCLFKIFIQLSINTSDSKSKIDFII